MANNKVVCFIFCMQNENILGFENHEKMEAHYIYSIIL